MLPRDMSLLPADSLGGPTSTKPTSTCDLGSLSRSRFSSEPCEGMILSVTPLRARIAQYCSALVSNELPGGPLVMVKVVGGAEWKNQKIVSAKSRPLPRTMTSASFGLRPKVSTSGVRNREESVLRVSFMFQYRSRTDAGFNK